MKVKVCGLTVKENIQEIIDNQADFCGFIFYPKSSRYIDEEQLKSWIADQSIQFGDTAKVGVFVDRQFDQILDRIHDFELDYVQLHGHESPEYCRQLRSFWEMTSMRNCAIIKAFAIDENFDFSVLAAYEKYCDLFLFDAKGKLPGGNGVQFDWSILSNYQGMTPFLLSGGITADDAEIIRKIETPQLTGVDINSGFEVEAGVKDAASVAQFIQKMKE